MVADPPEREVLRQLLPGMQVVSAADLRTLPEDGAVWLWILNLLRVLLCLLVSRLILTSCCHSLGDPLRLLPR